MKSPAILGLDVGGTFVKAAWLNGSKLQVNRRPIPDFIDHSGKAREIDPDALMACIHNLLDEVTGSRSCERILITGQMAGLAFVDEYGQALGPLISWQDTRFDSVGQVRGELSAEELACLGDGLRVGLPLVTLHRVTVPSSGFVTSLLGYVAGALAGTRASIMHATDAAALGLLDVANCAWSPAALAVAGIKADQLPAPVSGLASVGSSARFGGQVVTPVGDQQAALMGASLSEGEVSMNIATGCQVSMLTGAAESPAQLRPYFHGQYLQTVTHLPAGRLLAKAVREDMGDELDGDAWTSALLHADDPATAVGRAIETVAGACVDAARTLSSSASIVFSGGVAQRVDAVRERIASELSLPYRVYGGDDAALAGLQGLADHGSAAY